jgi:hypothetical protein
MLHQLILVADELCWNEARRRRSPSGLGPSGRRQVSDRPDEEEEGGSRLRWPTAVSAIAAGVGAVVAVATYLSGTGGSGGGAQPGPSTTLTTTSAPATPTPPAADAPVRRHDMVVLLPNDMVDLDSLAGNWGVTDQRDLAADIWHDGVKHELGGYSKGVTGILPLHTAGDFETCARMGKPYGHSLTASHIRQGQSLCALTDHQRVALVRITQVHRDSSGIPDEVTLDVTVYVPLHQV